MVLSTFIKYGACQNMICVKQYHCTPYSIRPDFITKNINYIIDSWCLIDQKLHI